MIKYYCRDFEILEAALSTRDNICIVIYILIAVTSGIAVKWLRLPRAKRALVVIPAAILCIVTVTMPFENLFVTYSSLEDAFEYSCVGDIVETADGSESSAVLYEEKVNVYKVFYAKKRGSGYKLSSSFADKNYAEGRLFVKSLSVYATVYKVRGTSDFYLYVLTASSEKPILSHSLGTELVPIYESVGDGYVTTLIAAIEYSEDYRLYVNNSEVELIVK